jgi:hypothetical protein
MLRIIVTPAGRERYLKILLKHLIKCKGEFDRWDIWLNTTHESDIRYIESLQEQYDFICIKYPTIPVEGTSSICNFFTDYINLDEIYVRLDDDIVYIRQGSLTRLFDARIKDTSSFLLYGNIINNAIITHLHQRTGNLDASYGRSSYACMCSTGWQNSDFAEKLHRDFLSKLAQDHQFTLPDWQLYDNERVSINVISWRGDEFLKFSGVVGSDEEQWLSVDKPRSLGTINRIIGDTLFVHYAFYPQRNHIDTTDILSRYEALAE